MVPWFRLDSKSPWRVTAFHSDHLWCLGTQTTCRRAVRVLQRLRAHLLIHQEVGDLHCHGAVTFAITAPCASSQLACTLYLLALYLSISRYQITKSPWFADSELCAKQMGETCLNWIEFAVSWIRQVFVWRPKNPLNQGTCGREQIEHHRHWAGPPAHE